MRWKVEYSERGDARVITRFLFFPKRVRDEVRWLEVAKIRQVAKWKGFPELGWYNDRWEND